MSRRQAKEEEEKVEKNQEIQVDSFTGRRRCDTDGSQRENSDGAPGTGDASASH